VYCSILKEWEGKNGKRMEKEWKKGRKKIRARAGPLAREPV